MPPLDHFIDTVLARFAGKPRQGRWRPGFQSTPPAGEGIDYENLIENGAPEGQRSDFFQSVVWHLAAKGWSIEQIVDELAGHPNGIGTEVRRPAARR